MRYGFALLASLLLAACCGCVVPDRDPRLQAELIAVDGGLQGGRLDAGPFRLAAWHRLDAPGQPLRVYIEGDGRAWISRRQVSLDPTPLEPMALRLAAVDPGPNVAYLARPCQYVSGDDGRGCDPHVWTDQRYGETVVAALDAAVDALRADAGAQRVELVGFSGGGALAVLVAARRDDVAAIRTVAGNLETEAFTEIHRVSPMAGSLNPREAAVAVAEIPQLHLVGGRDPVVPVQLAEAFQRALPHRRCSAVAVVEGATHSLGWVEQWPALLARPLPCLDETAAPLPQR